MSNTSQEQQLHARIKELEAEISSLKKRKKYGLVWEDKLEDVVAQCETHVPVLSEVKGKKISDKNQPSENIIIEGDNYHALSVLSYTHRNTIDVIYIDPPYNTGNSSWRYNNDYVDRDDSFKHSKWLSFISKRLRLARNLLKDDGILIFTIDDYEIATATLLLNEIFGEENWLNTIAVENNPRGRTSNAFFATSHEYYLFYAKDYKKASIENLPLTEEQKAAFSYEDEISSYRLLPLRKSGADSDRNDRPKQFYPIYINEDTLELTLVERKDYKKLLPIDNTGRERVWKIGKDNCEKKIKNGDVFAKQSKKGVISLVQKDRIKSGRKAKTIWVDPKYDASAHGSVLISKILGERRAFDYPKSLWAVVQALQTTVASKLNALVLDFFAGSGTTGHATLQLNKEDGGNRQFILCTNNENKIAEEVTYPRIKKVIQGYGDTEGLGGALRYYKTKLVDIEKLQKIPDERRLKLTYQAGEMIALRENTLDETEKNEWWQIFENNNKTVAIYFQEDKQKLRDLVKKIDDSEEVVLYVFSWGKNEYKNEFAEYQNIRVEDIPEPIIEVYKEINRLK